jgi:RHS repeat-associated protein
LRRNYYAITSTIRPRLRPVAVFVMLLFITGAVGWLAATRATGAALPPPPSSPPTAPKSPSTPQSGPPILVSHVTWQGRPAQPNNLQRLPLTLTLELSGTAFLYPNLVTDASGAFTVTLGSLPVGEYNWWVKGPQYLAKVGVVQLGGAPVTNVEMGTLQVGDANTDNLVDIADFGIVRASFGKSLGDTGYDGRADFNGDNTVDIVDFSLMRGNFGGFGPPAPPNAAPPDPSMVASPIDMSVVTDLGAATEFLYTGPSPIQTGVISGTIEITRVAVLRGKVLDRAGQPLPAATIKVLGHPEYGQTFSRADGMFDMAVNGGGMLTIEYVKDGYLPVQRDVEVSWKDYEWLPDIAMITLDPNVTVINLPSGIPMQVARGSVVSDTDGLRQQTLMFPMSATAVMTLPNNITQTLTTLHVRSTEYTVGVNGPEAMPGDLPPNSGYTYSPELSVDEAVAAGATGVGFSQPVISYLENFLGFPAGTIVPQGYYDRERGVWVASENGYVVHILGISGGMAELDTDGDGQVDNGVALGVTNAERQTLAALYQAGQSLWRVPLTHFSNYDSNWGVYPPDNAVPPNGSADSDRSGPCGDSASGSIIWCQDQTLGEMFAVSNTDFRLHYQSDRVPGRRAAYSMNIRVSGATVPTNTRRIELEILVAGQTFTQTFPATPNQYYRFVWDGTDAYGRRLQGRQPITVRIGNVFGAVYQYTPRFGYNGNGIPITGSQTRQELTLWQVWEKEIGPWDARPLGLGGWTLSEHHVYDPNGRILYLGDGRQRNTESLGNNVITIMAGGGSGGDGGPATQASVNPNEIVIAPDGSIYIADGLNHKVRRVRPDGIITAVAGNGEPGYSGDGGPATQAKLNFVKGLTLGPDGSFYIGDTFNHRVRRVGADGIITTIAGNGGCGYGGDGGPAVLAQLCQPTGLATGADGSLYIADRLNQRIRRIDPAGIISTMAGDGDSCGTLGDGGPATQAKLCYPWDVAMGLDGGLYIADSIHNRVRHVGINGIISTVAGNGEGSGWAIGDGGPATEAAVQYPTSVDVGPDGSLYIGQAVGFRMRRVGTDGVITTLAGNGSRGYSGDGGPALRAQVWGIYGVAVGPDGSIYVSDMENGRVRRVAPSLPGWSFTDKIIPAEDGSEVYIFNGAGRHLRTLDALTGALRYQFGYDNAGRLALVTDGDGNITTIEHDGNGNPTAILAPDGQRTTLALHPNGFLSSITSPAGETVGLDYTADGLLTTMTDPRNGIHVFEYDNLGRLTRDEDPAEGFQSLARVENGMSFTVTLTTAMSRTTTYRVEELSTGDQRKVNTSPDGLRREMLIRVDGSLTITETNGMVTNQVLGPDPRWGMLAPLAIERTFRSPAGLMATSVTTRTIRLANPDDRLSLQALTDTLTLNGRTFTSRYDASTRTITGTTATGRQAFITLNARGRVVRTQVAGLDPVAIGYDARGRPISITNGIGPSARTYSALYNSAGYVRTITDPISSTLQFGYDSIGRVLTQTAQDGRQIYFTYDANSNLTSLTPPGRPSHDFTYTATDFQEDYIPPDVGAGTNLTHYTYNLDKQLTQMVRPDGVSISLGYDNAGRLNSLTHPSGILSATYDLATGNLTRMTAPGGVTTTYSYDGSLPTVDTWAGPISGTVGHTYDNDFRVASQSVNGASNVSYQYDPDSLLTTVGDLVLTRNPQNGLLAGGTLGMVTDTLFYNSFGETTGYAAAANGSNLYSAQYTRDRLGRIAERTETTAGVTRTYSYTYDLTGRLTDVRRDGTLISHYEYDANDNRTSYMGPGGMITGTYDLQDRLLQYGTSVYTYTANGELLRKIDTSGAVGTQKGKNGPTTVMTTSYVYDVLGNLTVATLPDGTHIEYVVDGQNRRIGKKVNGALVQGFLYEGKIAPVAELDGSNNVVSRFVYGTRSNVPDYMVKSGVTYRVVADHLGSPRLVVNAATGQVAQRMDYDEFGNVLTDTNPGFQPFGFAGGLYDRHSKLTRFGARDYDAESGRWLAKDPIGFAGGDTNLYGYVLNDPINLLDPNGQSPIAEFACDQLVEEALMNAFESYKTSQEEQLVASQAQGLVTSYLWLGTALVIHHTCDGNGGPPSPPPPIPSSRLPKTGAKVVGGVGAGYVIYRVVRMVPSLAPPLWPTIGPNLAIP